MKEKYLQLLNEKRYAELKSFLQGMHEQDIVSLLEETEDNANLIKVFRLLDKDCCADVFSYASTELQQRIVELISDSELSAVIDDMYLDDAVDFVDELPANLVERVLRNANDINRTEINKFLSYAGDTAGSIMTNEFADVKKGTTAEKTIEKIRNIGNNLETINTIYVTDAKRIIEGCITIKDLILASPDTDVEKIMDKNVVYVQTSTDQEEVARLFKKYGVMVMPVVDKEKRLVGIITIDDAVDVIEEENTEDIQKMAALTPSDKEYLKTNVWKIWLQRIPWLLLLMVSAIFTSTIITHNEEILTASTFGIYLTACIPMLMDTGGNCGNQASATIIRGIALNEIKFKDIFKVMWKEFRVSIICAITLSLACFVKLLFLDGLFWVNSGVLISLTVSISMLCTVIIAKFIGCTLPLLAKKIHLDPAVMAAPIITTIVDAISLLTFCAISLAVLPF